MDPITLHRMVVCEPHRHIASFDQRTRLTKKDIGDIHRDYVTLDVIFIAANFKRHQAPAGHEDGGVIDPCNLVWFSMLFSW